MNDDDQGPDAPGDGRSAPLDRQGRRTLLQDLETIRSLLDDHEHAASRVDPAPGDRHPGDRRPGDRRPGDQRKAPADPVITDLAARIPVLSEVVHPSRAREEDTGASGDGADGFGAAGFSATGVGAAGFVAQPPQDPGSTARPATRRSTPEAESASEPAGGTAGGSRDTSPGTPPGKSPDETPDATPGARRTRSPSTPQSELFDPRAFADRLLNEDWRRERDAILDAARFSARSLDRTEGGYRAPTDNQDATDNAAGADALLDAADTADAAASADGDEALRERLIAALAPRVDALLEKSLADLRAALAETLREELRLLLDAPSHTHPSSEPSDAAARASAYSAHRDPDETD